MQTFMMLLSFMIVLSLSACNKDHSKPEGHVQIRIVNNTALRLSDAVIINEMYGSISPLQASAYHSFEDISYAPKLSFHNNGTLIEFFIGICGSPLPEPSYLEDGKYTYTVVADHTAAQGFGFTFTKD